MGKRSKQVIPTGNTPESLKESASESTVEKLTPAPASIESASIGLIEKGKRIMLKTILAMMQDDLRNGKPLLNSLALKEFRGGLLIYIRSDLGVIGFDATGDITLDAEKVTSL